MLYNPPHFHDGNTESLQQAIDSHGFATLVSNAADGPVISHLPLILERSAGKNGRLIGHIARANPHWKLADTQVSSVAVFLGPDAYVSPGWYPTKQESGKVVPTWNYSVIHASGPLTFHDDAVWLRDAVERLTSKHEGRRAQPWAVGDAPESFIAAQLRGIIGVEMLIDRLEGKHKLSQNRQEPDRQGVIKGLGGETDGGSAAIRALMLEKPE